MQNDAPQQMYVRPSEKELRKMLEARELEKELERKRLSRNFSWILLMIAAVLSGVFFSFPSNRKMITNMIRDHDDVTTESAPLSRKNAEPSNSAAEIPVGIKSFVTHPSDDSLKADIRFTMELFNFMQAPATKTFRNVESIPSESSKPKTPSKNR